MWMIYNHEDSPACGWIVESEKEAIKYCEENPEYSYCYISKEVNMLDMFCTVKFSNRAYTYKELLELMPIVELQQTNDRYTNTEIEFNGDYAKIAVKFDQDGNMYVY